ncbi:phage integrase N-terminal SAM-like domain-containing protein [Aliikangiella sp. IMCC44359]|uniref:phage integrase N-terminal SAM-like domain-containing protein n=1 Tax=Aliikangiella sp. IMCC44359 TaxID=3459125 RepID=UPI00403ABC00
MNEKDSNGSSRSYRLIDQLYQFADRQHLASQTKSNYISWILRYIRFHGKQHPLNLGTYEVENYLSHLAKNLNYDRKMQKSALSALRFLYEDFFKHPLDSITYFSNKNRSGYSKRFGLHHCTAIINQLDSSQHLMAKLGLLADLKIREVINLRLGDVDLKNNKIIIRHQNGQKKLMVNIPISIILELRIQIMKVHRLVQKEKQQKFGSNCDELTALAKCLEPDWQYLFPYTHSPKVGHTISYLNKMPLVIFKNNIKLAIQYYLRFMPNKESISKNIKIPTRFSAKANNKKTTQLQSFKHSGYLQKSFDFTSKHEKI